MSFSRSVYFSIVLAAHYLSSNSVPARTRGEWVARQKWTGVDRGREVG